MQSPILLVSKPDEPARTNCACASSQLYRSRSETGAHARCENDCACGAGQSLKMARGTTPSVLQALPWLHRMHLDDDHELWFDPFGDSNVIVANRSARRILDAFTTPASPRSVFPAGRDGADLLVEQLIGLGLLRAPDMPRPQLRPVNARLTAWLHVTNACNLRCTYCYIHKSREAMDEPTGRAAVDAVFRSALAQGFAEVELKYAGGEATLNFALVRTLHEHALALAAEHGLGLREVVLSNGLAISAENLDFLREGRITLMISLDGLGESHDAQRPLRNGRGSSAFVQRTIRRAVAAGVYPHLSITVTAQNVPSLPETVSFAIELGLRFNLNLYRDHGCVASAEKLRSDEAHLIDGLRAALATLERELPDYRLIDGMLDRSSFQAPHATGCGVGHNYLVIDQRGGVAACQMEIENTITHIDEPDPLRVLQTADFGFRNLPAAEKEGCRDCTWQWWCAGGCSLLTKRVTGRDDVKSPYCNVYKAIYPDVLRLEGLRLLKTRGE